MPEENASPETKAAPRWGAYFYNILLLLVGASLTYGLYRLDPRPAGNLGDLLFWGALIAWATWTQIPLPLNAAISQLFLILAAALLVFPLWVPPLLAVIFYFSPDWWKNPRYHLLADVFNRLQNAVAIAVGAYLYYALSHYAAFRLGSLDFTQGIALIAAGVSIFAVNAALVLFMIALVTKAPFRKIWRENFSPISLSYALLTPVALLFARLYTADPPLVGGWGGWALILFLIPLYYARYHWDELVKMKAAMAATIETLVQALDARDSYTRLHSERVAAISRSLAEGLKLDPSDVDKIVHGARVHDIGKIAIPDRILLKPGKLTKEEYDVIKTHPEKGVELLAHARGLDKEILNVVRHHHERWDGRGYPDGLAGQDIPEWARIVALADAYEAMTAGRPYRPPKKPEEALKEVEDNSGTQFDPKLVRLFKELWENDPVWKDREVFIRSYSSEESSSDFSSPTPAASDSGTSSEPN